MNKEEEFQAWLEEGLDFSEPAPPPAPAPVLDPNKPPSLSTQGINRGGIIRNPTTKRKTLSTNNPVANPQKPKPQKAALDSPEDDFKAQHPALAIPSIMTGMDHSTKNNGAPATQERQPVNVSFATTVGELIKIARQRGGTFIFGNEEYRYVISVQVSDERAPS